MKGGLAVMYTGLDLHKRYAYLTTMDERGKVIYQGKLPNHREVIRDFFQGLGQGTEVALEATANWYWMYEVLEELGLEVKLSHPGKTRAIASARIKTDKIDSRVLAHLLRTELLPTAYIPDKATRDTRELLRYRASLVRVRTGLKNKIHSLLAKKGINTRLTDLFGKRGYEYLEGLSLERPYRECLDGYLRILGALRVEIKLVDKELEAMVEKDPRAELLMSVPGVGHYTALLILGEIGDIKRFPSAKHLASYAGLVPSTYSSGQRTYHGPITREGSKWLRWIVVEASTHVVRRPGRLRKFYMKLRRAKGTGVARVAVARKLLGIIYHMVKHNKDYYSVMRASSLLPVAQ